MKSDFLIALTQLAAERNLPRDIVLSAIEAALVSAFRKDSIATGQEISVKLDPGTGDVSVYLLKKVVDEVENDLLEITLKDARKYKADIEVGDNVAYEKLPASAGRIAAQTAKQVVLQRLREAERELVYEEYAEKEGEVRAAWRLGGSSPLQLPDHPAIRMSRPRPRSHISLPQRDTVRST